MATFAAVLDACVLFPAYPRDLLLRLAEAGLYRPIITSEILDELARNLVRTGKCSEPAARRLVAAIAAAFEDDVVETKPAIVAAMGNHPKDRHVLAAAVEAGAGVIVTANIKDFPAEALSPWAIEAKAPDEFLVDLFWLSPARVVGTLAEQAQDYANPPIGFDDLLGFLGRQLPHFIALVRGYGLRRL